MLTREMRRVVCIHEAGHAVIHALGGALVHRVAVAPEGCNAWSYQARKGTGAVDLWGACESSDLTLVNMHLSWDDDEGCYQANEEGFNGMMRSLSLSQGAARGKQFLSDLNREMRVAMCAALAGPVAEAIYEDRPFDAWDPEGWGEPEGDLAWADGIAQLLPQREELDHASTLTLEALSRPEIWARVISLADELERVGDMNMDAVAAYLPQAAGDWPPLLGA